jgi:hypothetical protein
MLSLLPASAGFLVTCYSTLKMEEICWSELRGVTTHKTIFFVVTAVRTSHPHAILVLQLEELHGTHRAPEPMFLTNIVVEP